MSGGLEIEAKLLVPDRKGFDHLLGLRHLGPCSLEPGPTVTVRDTYLDTRQRALLAAGWACRRREEAGRILVTLKAASTAGDAIHRRREVEAALLADAAPALWPSGEPRDTVVALIGSEPLAELFRLRQVRHPRVARSGGRVVAAVSLDDVLAEVGTGARHWRELEIELLPDGTEADLAAMTSWVRERFGLAPSLLSKFERALDAGA